MDVPTMSPTLIRALVAGIVAVVLVLQMMRATGLWRKRAFGLGALGFALIAGSNLVAAPGAELITFALIGLGAVAILGALVSLWRAYNAGELSDQLDRARAALDAARNTEHER
jgi:hypothetical protein